MFHADKIDKMMQINAAADRLGVGHGPDVSVHGRGKGAGVGVCPSIKRQRESAGILFISSRIRELHRACLNGRPGVDKERIARTLSYRLNGVGILFVSKMPEAVFLKRVRLSVRLRIAPPLVPCANPDW